MPGIKISRTITSALPQEQRDDLKEFLKAKSGGVCFLCESPINEAADDIEADHDKPSSEGGIDDRGNLWLAHKHCNRFKRAAPSVHVRPYLKFERFLDSQPSGTRYSGCLSHFKIEPKPSKCIENKTTLDIEFPDGSFQSCPIFSESNSRGELKYVYAQVPRCALYNDDEVQPRIIKKKQAWAIYFDLNRNPLYEAPGCRLIKSGDFHRVVMFDGQHKTVATWMLGRESIVAKIYLNLERAPANELVNSIQAKIPKLTLSPLELIAKMADEVKSQIEGYIDDIGYDSGSEKGFLTWLPATEKPRAKQAMESARLQTVIEDADFEFLSYIRRVGHKSLFEVHITEGQLKTKVLKQLVFNKPLDESWEESTVLRLQECHNIINLTNIYCKYAFSFEDQDNPTEQELERMQRLTYQGSLQHAFFLFKTIIATHCSLQDRLEETMLRAPQEESEIWGKIDDAVKRYVDHPVWLANYSMSGKMKAVKDSFAKNQNVRKTLDAVKCDLGYLMSGILEGDCCKD